MHPACPSSYNHIIWGHSNIILWMQQQEITSHLPRNKWSILSKAFVRFWFFIFWWMAILKLSTRIKVFISSILVFADIAIIKYIGIRRYSCPKCCSNVHRMFLSIELHWGGDQVGFEDFQMKISWMELLSLVMGLTTNKFGFLIKHFLILKHKLNVSGMFHTIIYRCWYLASWPQ